jgi:hypothetical protein
MYRLAIPAAALLALIALPSRVQAIPAFAHRYGFTCQQCHTTIPHLNGFGLRFYHNGFRLPGRPAEEFTYPPIAVAVNLAYTSEHDPTGLPKAIVDEVELLSGGSYGHVSYFSDFYIVDGGRPGSPRDVWAQYWGTPSERGNVLRFRTGSMTLPLPVDPETFRETENHYAVFDQTIVSNPFNFFDVHSGAELAFGNPNQGLDARVLLLRSHDPQSPLPVHGSDTMGYVQWGMPNVTLSAYGYRGTRVLGGPDDAFGRYGFGITSSVNRLTIDTVLQDGTDSNADGAGTFVHSSGGFMQMRWEFSRSLAGIVRYDGTEDTSGSFLRETTFAAEIRPMRNARLVLEDVLTHTPQTKTIFNAGLQFAY